MPALWVLAVLAVLLTALLFTRLRLTLTAKDGAMSAEARAGFLRVRLYPPPERKAKPKKARRKRKKKPEAKPQRDRGADAARILRLVRRVWSPALDVLRNIQGAVEIDPLTVRVVYGGREEPADAAILCGDTLALVWAVMPTLEQVCRIPRPSITVNADFDAPETRIEADVSLTLRVWALLISLRPLLALLRREDAA